MNATGTLHDRGQSLWLDNITRELLESGTLARYIDELSVTGLTSNPTIFDHAIKNSSAYDAAIRKKVKEAWGDRVTTIFPRQGQYARDANAYRPADLTVERIGDLLTHDLPELLSPEVTR